MEETLMDEIVKAIPNIGSNVAVGQQEKLKEIHDQATLIGQSDNAARPQQKTNVDPTIGRNDPCPCGSGKKYKHCGLKNTEEHQERMKSSK